MPRAVRRIPLADQRVEVLDANLRIALETGRAFVGDAGLVTAADWRRAWNRWGSEILPAFVKARPGTRPTGMRCAGLLAPRRLVRPLPETHGFYTATVDGVLHVSGMCVYAACEADQLLDECVIDADEHRQHFESRAHERYCRGERV